MEAIGAAVVQLPGEDPDLVIWSAPGYAAIQPSYPLPETSSSR